MCSSCGGIAGVDDVQEQVGVGRLLEGGAEGGEEVLRAGRG